MISDERLDRILHGSHGGPNLPVVTHAEGMVMARELIAARKVVEAATNFQGYTRGLRCKPGEGPANVLELDKALAEYQAAKARP